MSDGDIRDLERAQAATEARLDAHLEACTRRYDEQSKGWQTFRGEFRTSVTGLQTSISAVHGKIDAGLRRAHSRIDRLVLGGLGALIIFLITVVAWLVNKNPPWAT